MGALWQSLIAALTKDDLFLRVSLFVFSLLALLLGVEAVRWLINPAAEHWGWSLAIGIMGALFLLWGSIVIVSAFTPPASRWSRFAEKCYPNPTALDDAAIFLIAVLLPAVAVTVLLRAVGVRGYVS